MRRTASIVTLFAGVASLALFAREARSTPAVLLFLYTGWILLPLFGLAVLRTRASLGGTVLDIAAMLVSAGCVTVYALSNSGVLKARPAAVYLMTPLAAWIVIAVAAFAAWRSRSGEPPSH